MNCGWFKCMSAWSPEKGFSALLTWLSLLSLPFCIVTWHELGSQLSHTRIRFWAACRQWEPKCSRYTAEWFPSEPVLTKLKTLEISLPHPCTLIEELHFFYFVFALWNLKKKKSICSVAWCTDCWKLGLTEMTTVIWVRPGTNCFSEVLRLSPVCKIRVPVQIGHHLWVLMPCLLPDTELLWDIWSFLRWELQPWYFVCGINYSPPSFTGMKTMPRHIFEGLTCSF